MAPEVRFIDNRLGGVALVIDGCKYRINRRSGTTVYWRCFFRWCRANAVVEDGKLKSSCGKHICSQVCDISYNSYYRYFLHLYICSYNSQPITGIAAKQGQGRHLKIKQTTASASDAHSSSRRGASTEAATMASKIAMRTGQGSTAQPLTRKNTNKGKALSSKSSTNNNLVVRRKSKATEEDNKIAVQHQQPSPNESSQPTSSVQEPNSPKQVSSFVW